ncbi:MAG: alpha/beta hydrolase [Xanthobacteraceae bacterium]|nr:alpha/beta hydrolase [Xanthobacteraceae bacterium]
MTDRIKTTRRGALGVMAAGAAAATGAIPAAAQGGRKTFVLVHGAWHGAWCWRRVADLLEKKGHKVFTPTLTGLGACSHLLSKDVNLATHFTDVVNLIEWENLSDVVLVGHSYGGYIVSGVAEKVGGKIGSIVFLDAFLPENGESLAAGASQPVKDAIAAALGRGELSLKPVPAAVFRVNEADRAWVDGKCTPHPIATLTDKITLTGARDRIAKKSYIRAAGYPSIPFDAVLAKVKLNSTWKTYEMTAGHDAMVDQPQELTDLLLQVA